MTEIKVLGRRKPTLIQIGETTFSLTPPSILHRTVLVDAMNAIVRAGETFEAEKTQQNSDAYEEAKRRYFDAAAARLAECAVSGPPPAGAELYSSLTEGELIALHGALLGLSTDNPNFKPLAETSGTLPAAAPFSGFTTASENTNSGTLPQTSLSPMLSESANTGSASNTS
jgi:hypothetical protein